GGERAGQPAAAAVGRRARRRPRTRRRAVPGQADLRSGRGRARRDAGRGGRGGWCGERVRLSADGSACRVSSSTSPGVTEGATAPPGDGAWFDDRALKDR